MSAKWKPLTAVRGLLPVLVVIAAVVAVGTVVGGAFSHRGPATADAGTATVVTATATGADTQSLVIKDWGVQAALPLAAEMPLVDYVSKTTDSVGLSSANLAKLGAQCSASQSALGTLTRYPVGTYHTATKTGVGGNLVATVGTYDYVYEFPQTSCTDTAAGTTIVNQQETVVLEALGSLVAAQ